MRHGVFSITRLQSKIIPFCFGLHRCGVVLKQLRIPLATL
jgi:hypothetical protein